MQNTLVSQLINNNKRHFTTCKQVSDQKREIGQNCGMKGSLFTSTYCSNWKKVLPDLWDNRTQPDSTTEQTITSHIKTTRVARECLKRKEKSKMIIANLINSFHSASDTRPFIFQQKSLPSTLSEEILRCVTGIDPMPASELLWRWQENIRRLSSNQERMS